MLSLVPSSAPDILACLKMLSMLSIFVYLNRPIISLLSNSKTVLLSAPRCDPPQPATFLHILIFSHSLQAYGSIFFRHGSINLMERQLGGGTATSPIPSLYLVHWTTRQNNAATLPPWTDCVKGGSKKAKSSRREEFGDAVQQRPEALL